MNHLLVVHNCKMKEDLTTLAITRVGENFLQVCLKKVWTGNFSTSIKHSTTPTNDNERGGGGGKYLYHICYSLDSLGFLCVVLQ